MGECGSFKHSKILRFLYAVRPAISTAIKTWVAVARTEDRNSDILFVQRVQVNAQSCIEDTISSRRKVPIKAQRCADCFILREFRIIGTIVGRIILDDPATLKSLKFPARTTVGGSLKKQILRSLVESWFLFFHATEHMIRATVNEPAVIRALCKKEFILDVQECSMLASKDSEWLA